MMRILHMRTGGQTPPHPISNASRQSKVCALPEPLGDFGDPQSSPALGFRLLRDKQGLVGFHAKPLRAPDVPNKQGLAFSFWR